MIVDADPVLHEDYVHNLQQSNLPMKKMDTNGDPRVIRGGYLIRSAALDELPQLWNVIKGEMSMVGPRPERPEFVKKFREQFPDYMVRHRVKCGITGWAQVNGYRGDSSIKKRLEYDLYYIQNWSIGLDMKIIWRTLKFGFWKNAY